MSAPKEQPAAAGGPNDFRIPANGAWASAWKMAAVTGLIGVVVSAVGFTSDPARFAFSYLFAYVAVLALALGALFFVIVQHLTSSAWSVTIRRPAEILASGVLVLTVLFAPVAFTRDHLFSWMAHGHHGDHAEPAEGHGDAHVAEGHGDAHVESAQVRAEHAAHARIVASKDWYLNLGFFSGRAVSYFVVWLALAFAFYRWSTQQDTSKDPSFSLRAQRLAPPAIFLFALSLTFAAFDWLMSLEPSWYSTIFGVYYFASSVVCLLAVLTLIGVSLHSHGVVGKAVNVEHLHDLGKLLFGFVVFWAYIGFSQFMLIWYAGIPEEATYYHRRWVHGWEGFSVFLLLGHFVLPFFFLLSRNVKRKLGALATGAGWMVFMHLVDMYWWVLPYHGDGHFAPSWIDVGCVLAVAGIYFAYVFHRMLKHPVVPVGDPRLPRSLRFQNA